MLLGWRYRKSHLINKASGAGTNYQIRIIAHYGSGTDNYEHVYLNSHCKTDFGDVRFTGNDGETLLDYWMESKVDSNNAIFWVEVAGDLSTVNQTIYIYYGNANATTTSNGHNTFLFFDDFNDDLSKWTLIEGTATIVNGQMRLGYTGYNAIRSNNLYPCQSRTRVRLQTNARIRFGRSNNYSTTDHSPYIDDSAIIETRDKYYTQTTNEGAKFERTGSYYDTNYHVYDFLIGQGSTCMFYRDSYLMTSTHTTNVPDEDMWIIFYSLDNYFYVDWVFISKYVNPEPAHDYYWGKEQRLVPLPTSANTVVLMQGMGLI